MISQLARLGTNFLPIACDAVALQLFERTMAQAESKIDDMISSEPFLA
jgi:hypothetical protein